MDAQRLTEETLGNLAGQAQYDFMSVLRQNPTIYLRQLYNQIFHIKAFQ